jgi:hypothetical protein
MNDNIHAKVRLGWCKVSDRPVSPAPKELPIVRIFRKVLGRQMTAEEKRCFGIRNAFHPARRNGAKGKVSRKKQKRN